MGISLKNWMGQRGLNKESAMSLLGMASATFYRHFNGEVGSTMDEKLIQIDGLVTQLAAYSEDGRQALNGMAEKRRRELLGTAVKGVPTLILGNSKSGPVLRELRGNILVVGLAGTGHTRHLLIPNFEHFMGRLVVVDPRCEITVAMITARTKLTGRPCVVVDLSQEIVDVPVTADVVMIGGLQKTRSGQGNRVTTTYSSIAIDQAKARNVLWDIHGDVDKSLPTLFWFDPMMNALGKEFARDRIIDGFKEGAFTCLGTHGQIKKDELEPFGTIVCLGLNDHDDGLALGVFPKWFNQSLKELLIIEGSNISPAIKADPISDSDDWKEDRIRREKIEASQRGNGLLGRFFRARECGL